MPHDHSRVPLAPEARAAALRAFFRDCYGVSVDESQARAILSVLDDAEALGVPKLVAQLIELLGGIIPESAA